MSGKIIKSTVTVEHSKISIQQLLLSYLKKHGTKIHMIEYESGHKFTFQNLYDDSLKLGFAMKTKLKVNPGDFLLVYGYNSYECLCALIAGLVVGAVSMTMRCIDSASEVFKEITNRDIKYLFVSHNKRDTFIKKEKELPSLKHIIIIDNFEEETEIFALKSLIRDAKRALREDEIYDPKGNRNTIAMVLESSGTSGPAKGVLLGHYDLATVIAHFPEGLVTKEEDVLSGHSFIAHLSGMTMHFRSIMYGIRIVTFQTPNIEKIATAIEKYKITWILLTPSHLNLVNQLNQKLNLSSLTHLFVAGSRVLKQSVKTFLQKYPCKYFLNVYSMTEVTSLITIAVNSKDIESIGKVAAGAEIKVIDTKTGETLGANKDGEICVKGPIKFKGYHKNDEATKAMVDEEGWIHTADIGYFDDDENFFIVERIKDIIRQHGFTYSPVDIENVLLQHQAVKEVAVVGIPIGIDEEISHAFIVLKDEFKDNRPTEKEILTFVNEQVSEMRRIRGTVFIVEELPKTEFGKVLRRKLREDFTSLLRPSKEEWKK